MWSLKNRLIDMVNKQGFQIRRGWGMGGKGEGSKKL